jgi:uncharacterized protein YkwD
MSFARLALVLTLLAALPARAEAPDSFPDQVLGIHNTERSRLGIAPLAWNPALAEQARNWARSLAARGVLQHSSNPDGTGENLWMGTRRAYAPEAMVGAFVSEARHFSPGRFPAVSRTGRWSDVGHYTQLIWPETREVGCALASGRNWDVLVCRYYPAGNIVGKRVP